MLPSVVVCDDDAAAAPATPTLADAAEDPDSDGAASDPDSPDSSRLECPVCLQACVHPVQLPCNHIFCFLCVKGVLANQRRRCALCRTDIPAEFLERPNLIQNKPASSSRRRSSQGGDAHDAATGESTEAETPEAQSASSGFQWFYEGFHGWWQYDERTSAELEEAHRRGSRRLELLIAGFVYVIDFENMWQFRRTDPSKRRRIKRDLSSISKKGIAGIRIQDAAGTSPASVGPASPRSDDDAAPSSAPPPSVSSFTLRRPRFNSFGDESGVGGDSAASLAIPPTPLSAGVSPNAPGATHPHYHSSSATHLPGTPFNTPAGPLTPASGASAASSAGGTPPNHGKTVRVSPRALSPSPRDSGPPSPPNNTPQTPLSIMGSRASSPERELANSLQNLHLHGGGGGGGVGGGSGVPSLSIIGPSSGSGVGVSGADSASSEVLSSSTASASNAAGSNDAALHIVTGNVPVSGGSVVFGVGFPLHRCPGKTNLLTGSPNGSALALRSSSAGSLSGGSTPNGSLLHLSGCCCCGGGVSGSNAAGSAGCLATGCSGQSTTTTTTTLGSSNSLSIGAAPPPAPPSVSPTPPSLAVSSSSGSEFPTGNHAHPGATITLHHHTHHHHHVHPPLFPPMPNLLHQQLHQQATVLAATHQLRILEDEQQERQEELEAEAREAANRRRASESRRSKEEVAARRRDFERDDADTTRGEDDDDAEASVENRRDEDGATEGAARLRTASSSPELTQMSAAASPSMRPSMRSSALARDAAGRRHRGAVGDAASVEALDDVRIWNRR